MNRKKTGIFIIFTVVLIIASSTIGYLNFSYHSTAKWWVYPATKRPWWIKYDSVLYPSPQHAFNVAWKCHTINSVLHYNDLQSDYYPPSLDILVEAEYITQIFLKKTSSFGYKRWSDILLGDSDFIFLGSNQNIENYSKDKPIIISKPGALPGGSICVCYKNSNIYIISRDSPQMAIYTQMIDNYNDKIKKWNNKVRGFVSLGACKNSTLSIKRKGLNRESFSFSQNRWDYSIQFKQRKAYSGKLTKQELSLLYDIFNLLKKLEINENYDENIFYYPTMSFNFDINGTKTSFEIDKCRPQKLKFFLDKVNLLLALIRKDADITNYNEKGLRRN